MSPFIYFVLFRFRCYFCCHYSNVVVVIVVVVVVTSSDYSMCRDFYILQVLHSSSPSEFCQVR